MKKATTKILLAALSLIMAIGIATGSTFAWFISNRTVKVGAIDAQVTTGTQGLYVAVKDSTGNYGTFTTALDSAAITGAIFTGSGAVVLDALTTGDNGVTLVDRASTGAAAFSASATDNKYLEFTLKFRTTTAQRIYLGYKTSTAASSSTITTGTPVATLVPVKAWTTIAENTYGTHAQISAGADLATRAAYAARVAFITGTTPSGVIWAPYDYTVQDGTGTDGFNTSAGFYKNVNSSNLASDYEHNMIGTTNYQTTNFNAVTLCEEDDAASGTATTGATVIATTALNDGKYEAEVTIRLWLEGTDGDCLNSIFGDTLSLQLVFNSITVTP